METKKKIVILAKIVIVLLCAAAFLPSLKCDFVLWDDPSYVTENEAIKTLSLKSISSLFVTGFVGQYCPVTMFAYMLTHHFFALNPFYYHLVNYLLNILVSLAVFGLIISVSGNVAISFFTAAIFAVHPLHVESVAWISELKDVLCALFYIYSLIRYVAYVNRGGKVNYILSVIFCLLALTSKAMAVSLPFALLAIDIYYRRRVGIRTILEKVPFFLMAAAISALTVFFHTQTEAFHTVFPFDVKVYYLVKSLVFYFTKVVWPVNLSAVYSMAPSLPQTMLAQTAPRLIGLAVLAATIVMFGLRDRRIFLGASLFFLTILPVLKIKTVSTAWAADRYMYIPSIGLIFVLALIIDNISRSGILKRVIRPDIVMLSAAIFFITAFSYMTWNRCLVWQNTRTLFMDVLLKDPGIGVFYANIGEYYEEKGDLLKAEKFYERSLLVSRMKKQGVSIGDIKAKIAKIGRNRLENARLKETQKERSEEARLVNSIGEIQGSRGDVNTAISLFREALELDPRNPDAHNNIGVVLYEKKDYEGAAAYFKKALEIDPKHRKAGYNLRAISAGR